MSGEPTTEREAWVKNPEAMERQWNLMHPSGPEYGRPKRGRPRRTARLVARVKRLAKLSPTVNMVYHWWDRHERDTSDDDIALLVLCIEHLVKSEAVLMEYAALVGKQKGGQAE